eukprot:jgi/Astpho2/5934/Aster-02422
MPKRSLPPGKEGAAKKRKLQGGLSLEQFASAKASGFDKKHERDKQKALNAKQVNKYRKLRQKLQQTGRLNPKVPVERLDNLDSIGGAAELDVESREDRALARAGPAPDTDSEDKFGDADEQAAVPQAPQSRRPQSSQATAWRQQQRKASGKKKGRRDNSTHQFQQQKPKPQLQRLAEEVQAKKDAQEQQQQAERMAAEERKARLAVATKARKQQTAQMRKKTKRGQPIMKHRIINMLSALQG